MKKVVCILFFSIFISILFGEQIKTSSGAILDYLKTNKQGCKEYINIKDGSIMICIPAGDFLMGNSRGRKCEVPVHLVYLDEYYISKYEITNAQFIRFLRKTNYDYPININLEYQEYHEPVSDVSWKDATAYCKWAGLRLPTEAEWEKAARGTDGRKYPWGDHAPYYNKKYYANYYQGEERGLDGYRWLAPVGVYPVGHSPYGAMDMAGNISEWCDDWHSRDYYQNSPYKNPKGPDEGKYKVFRGGSFDFEEAPLCTGKRWKVVPTVKAMTIGFRAAATP